MDLCARKGLHAAHLRPIDNETNRLNIVGGIAEWKVLPLSVGVSVENAISLAISCLSPIFVQKKRERKPYHRKAGTFLNKRKKQPKKYAENM